MVNLVLDGLMVLGQGTIDNDRQMDHDSLAQHWAVFALQAGHINYDISNNDNATLS